MRISLLDREFEIKATLVDCVKGFPNDNKDTAYHNQFTVTVKLNNKSRRFSFFGSARDCQEGKTTIPDKDFIYVLECFLSDGYCAIGSFEDFCGELGYDQDSRNAEHIYKSCQKTLDQLNGLGIDDSELADLLNAIRDIE
jgi:hypothetical protein